MKKTLLVLLGSIALTSAAFAADSATKEDCDSCCKDCGSCCETTSGATTEKKSDAANQTSAGKTAEKTAKPTQIAKKS